MNTISTYMKKNASAMMQTKPRALQPIEIAIRRRMLTAWDKMDKLCSQEPPTTLAGLATLEDNIDLCETAIGQYRTAIKGFAMAGGVS